MRRVIAIVMTSVSVGMAVSSGQEAPGAIVSGDVGRRVDAYLTRLAQFGFSGGVLIAEDGQIVLRKGYGLANRTTGQPYAVDTVASIGSLTKQFTGAAILKLEMQGRLRVSDPIARYLPDVPADKRGITIHHLLTHTAGFAGDLGGADNEPIGRDALVARVLASRLASAPGERFEYSNEGYSLAGAIVERVSGQPYEAFLREHLFLPAGMMDTGYLLPTWASGRLARGYTVDGDEWGLIHGRGWRDEGPGWYLMANGGMHSTLDDMYRWHQALEDDRVLSADARRKYQTGAVPATGGERYAYGWGVQRTLRGTDVVTHNGGNGIFFADVRRYLDERVVIVAMSNSPVVPATRLAPRQLDALVFGGEDVPLPPAVVDVPIEQRTSLAGVYQLASGGTLTVTATAEGLWIESDAPSLLRAIGGLVSPGGRFAAIEARTRAIVEASARDDYRVIHEAFNEDGRPLDVVAENQRRLWRQWQDEHGDFAGADLIGTTAGQGDPVVVVRLRFERGIVALRFIWGPRRLLGFRTAAASAARLLAESPDVWVHYSYETAEPLRVSFDNSRVRVTGRGLDEEGGRLPLPLARW